MIGLVLYALGSMLGLYLLVIAAFVVAGRREAARAIAGFVPDCVVLFARLLRDDRVPRRSKLLAAALIPYLAMPFDLVPDFVPVAGQLDDAVIVAFVLRRIARSPNAAVLDELWPGPSTSLAVIHRLAGRRVRKPLKRAPSAVLPGRGGVGGDRRTDQAG